MKPKSGLSKKFGYLSKRKNIFYLILVAVLVTYIFINSDSSIVIAYSKFDKSLKYVQFLYNGPIGFHTPNVVQSYTNSDIDVFGIRKLYESKPDTFEWYVNMVNPKEDPYLYNYDKMVKNPDGSYSIGNFSRLSVYSKDGVGYNEGSMQTYNFTKLDLKGYWYKPNDWKNVEMTGEYRYRGGNGQGITHYVRSEDHSLLHNGCGASSYKNKIYFDGTSNFNKEQTHPFSWKTSHFQHNYGHLKDHWFGFKTVVYNLPTGHVKLENWLDAFNDDNWTKIGQYIDEGGWGKNGTKCGGRSDQILTWGSPMVTFRWDDLLIDFRNLSVREILPPIHNTTTREILTNKIFTN